MFYILYGDNMKRRFKSKSKKKIPFLFILLIILSLFLLNKFVISKINLSSVNNMHIFDLNRTKLLLKTGLNFYEDINKHDDVKNVEVFKEIIKPKIYLYNTHNKEEYVDGNIMLATNNIKNKLIDSVDVIYEQIDVVGMLNERKLNYNQAYLITKDIVRNNLNNDISLYIDFHRDAISHDLSSAVIDNKSYAKVLFVIGALHDNYKTNYEIANVLNKKLKNINPNLSRGILVRENARYNQELSGNVLLIELGGNENNMNEINNTIDILTSVIKEYLYE